MRFDVINLQTVSSTNETLQEILAKSPSVAEGTVVSVSEQTKGKGQIGNKWVSDKDKNLLFSVLLRPSFLDICDHFFISIVASLSVADYLSKRGAANVKVKWPNDVYIGDLKACGILVENVVSGRDIDTSVIGIGININQTDFSVDAGHPVSLTHATGNTYNLKEELGNVLECVSVRYESLRNGDTSKLKDDYKSFLYRYGVSSNYIDVESGNEFCGTITDVRNDGQIEIKDTDGGIHIYMFKEVEFVI